MSRPIVIASLFLSCILLQIGQVQMANSLNLSLFNPAQFPQAICNDGSPSGYYFKPATTQPNRWVIHLQGGWWCWDETTCLSRAQNSPEMVSSKTWRPAITPGGIFNADPSKSPEWAGVNLVYIPYCTSDSWVGDGVSSVGQTTWQFRGRRVVEAVFETFFGKGNTSYHQPQEILFSGCSAGGQGLLNNLDDMAQFVSQNILPGVVIKGLADAGWMMNLPSTKNPNSDVHTQFVKGWNLWKPRQTVCTQANPTQPWDCLFSPNLVPYLNTPVMIQTSQYDSFQIPYDCCSPPFTTPDSQAHSSAIAQAFRSSLRALIKTPNAVFSPSCYTHCLVEGSAFTRVQIPYTLSQSLSNWFFEEVPLLDKVIDDCGFNCSNSCK